MTDVLSTRVGVVTGGTSGLGWWIARGLAARGLSTVIVGRSEGRARQAARTISEETGNPRVQALGVTDLASRPEVERIASELLARYPRIHVLVHNAGAYLHRREVTPEGLERTFALNVVAPFLLTERLTPRLVESAPARVVLIASAAHRGHRVPFDDLQSERSFRGFRTYGRTKLEVILLAREFARRLGPRGVRVVAVHPGIVATAFGLNNPGPVGRGVNFFVRLLGRTPERAAEGPVRLAVDPGLGTTGLYFVHDRVRRGSRASREMASARRLFEACERLVAA